MTSPSGDSRSTTPSEEAPPLGLPHGLEEALGSLRRPPEPADLDRWVTHFTTHPIWDSWLRPTFEYEIARRLELLTSEDVDKHPAIRAEVRVIRMLMSTILKKASAHASSMKAKAIKAEQEERVQTVARNGPHGPRLM